MAYNSQSAKQGAHIACHVIMQQPQCLFRPKPLHWPMSGIQERVLVAEHAWLQSRTRDAQTIMQWNSRLDSIGLKQERSVFRQSEQNRALADTKQTHTTQKSWERKRRPW